MQEVMVLAEKDMINWSKKILRCPHCHRYHVLFNKFGLLTAYELYNRKEL